MSSSKMSGTSRWVSTFQKKIGIPIKFTMLPRYGNIIDSFNSGSMDAAFWTLDLGYPTGIEAETTPMMKYLSAASFPLA